MTGQGGNVIGAYTVATVTSSLGRNRSYCNGTKRVWSQVKQTSKRTPNVECIYYLHSTIKYNWKNLKRNYVKMKSFSGKTRQSKKLRVREQEQRPLRNLFTSTIMAVLFTIILINITVF